MTHREIRSKFDRLAEVQKLLAEAKDLYKEHDALMEEIIPLFVKKTAKGFTIRRKFSVGRKTFMLEPSFFDSKKDSIKAKIWKASANQTFNLVS